MEVLTGKPGSLPLFLSPRPLGAKRETEAWEEKSERESKLGLSPAWGGALKRILASCYALLDGKQGPQRHVVLGGLSRNGGEQGQEGRKSGITAVMNIHELINIHDDLL